MGGRPALWGPGEALMQIRRSMPALGRIPAAEYGVTLGDFFFPVFLGERLGSRLQGLALAVVGAALIAASAQVVIAIPGTPVPITGQTFGVLLVGAALGARRSVASLGLYLAIGMLGAPVFQSGTHGIERFVTNTSGALALAPTGGYLIGMLGAGWLVGRLADLGWDRTVLGTVGAMVIGNLMIYACGVSWLAVAAHFDAATAIAKGLTPFLIGDVLKLAIAAGVFPSAWWYVNNGRSAGPR
jgi:biotin transport system substrate-specific component